MDPAGLEHQATMDPDVRTVAVMFDPQMIPHAGDRARILAVSPLIREMMIYALRWPIDRAEGDDVSDGFFRTLADLVVEALDHEAPLSLPTSEHPIVAAAMAFTKEHLQSVSADRVSRAVAVSERTLRRLFQDELGLSWRTYLSARADAAGDGASGLTRADGAGNVDRGWLRQPQLVHPRLHAIQRGDTVDVPEKGCPREGLTPVGRRLIGVAEQSFAQQHRDRSVPSLKLRGAGQRLGQVALDVAAQNEGAESQHERVDGGPRQIDIRAGFAAFPSLIPPRRAGIQQGVEDHVSDRPPVDQCAADIVRDVGILGDHRGDAVTDLGNRVRCGVWNRLRDLVDHRREERSRPQP